MPTYERVNLRGRTPVSTNITGSEVLFGAENATWPNPDLFALSAVRDYILTSISVGGIIQLTVGNADSLTTTQEYYIPNGASVTKLNGAIGTGGVFLDVLANAAGTSVTQTVTRPGSSTPDAYRTLSGGNWSAWTYVLSDANSPAQRAVLGVVASVPGSPAHGDRYVVPVGATGAWSGFDKYIAQWDADENAWNFYMPQAGFHLWNTADSKLYLFNGSSNWVTFGGSTPLLLDAGTVSAPALAGTSDTNTGIYWPAADTLAVTVGGVEAMRWEGVGNWKLPSATNTAKSGILYRGSFTWMHDFNYGNNGTVTTTGYNTFLGLNAGNLTMGSTATDGDQASINTGIGYIALNALTKGHHNVAVGAYSMNQCTEGYSNTAVGTSTLYAVTTGYQNVGVGFRPLLSLTTGYNNMAIGTAALNSLVSGFGNCAVGSGGVLFSHLGNYSTGIGHEALVAETGNYNTGIGAFVGGELTSGEFNTFIGYSCARGITTGTRNTVIGAQISALPAATSDALILGDGNGQIRIWADNANNIRFGTTTTVGTGAARVLALINGTAPSTSPANTGQVYMESGALKYRSPAGTITTMGAA